MQQIDDLVKSFTAEGHKENRERWEAWRRGERFTANQKTEISADYQAALNSAEIKARIEQGFLSASEVFTEHQLRQKMLDAFQIVHGKFLANPHNEDAIRGLAKAAIADDEKKSFLIFGGLGTGKSSMGKVLNQFYISSHQRSRLFAIRSALQLCQESKEPDFFEKRLYGGLMIDDLGTEPETVNNYGTKQNVIIELIYARYDVRNSERAGVTHITTNLTPDAILERYGERVFERLAEMCTFVHMGGASYRI